jgi:hypothetical protein
MFTEEFRLPDIETLTMLSGLPEGMRAEDMLDEWQKDMVRMGKSDKEVAALRKRIVDAFTQERDRSVEACYLAGYLKGMADMAQRFRSMLEARDMLSHSEDKTKAAV